MCSAPWNTIENDPEIFVNMIRRWGVEKVNVQEIYSLEEDTYLSDSSVMGLVFLFQPATMGAKEQSSSESTNKEDSVESEIIQSARRHIYFAQQTTKNACATHALLHVLFNQEHTQDTLSDDLTQLYMETTSSDPIRRGNAIGRNVLLREVHNSLGAVNRHAEGVTTKGDVPEDYHYVAYVPLEGHLWELDGLEPQPIHCGELHSSDKDWLKLAMRVVSLRIQRLADRMHSTFPGFSLLAITK